ncbi:hypothetical protein JYT16_01395 [Gemmatimonas aurantiaca]|nr:hypothetical protein [Gemmatimonas aurantiaca]
MKNMTVFLRRFIWAGIFGGQSIILCFIIPVGDLFWFSLIMGVTLAIFGFIFSDSVEH